MRDTLRAARLHHRDQCYDHYRLWSSDAFGRTRRIGRRFHGIRVGKCSHVNTDGELP